jgi:hypothetical protein
VKDAGEPQVAIRLLSDMTSEQARDARARAWSFVFQCWQEKQKAACEESRLYDAEGEFNGIRATSILSENP